MKEPDVPWEKTVLLKKWNSFFPENSDLGNRVRKRKISKVSPEFRVRKRKISKVSPEFPVGLEAGINLYAYVMGNPVNFADPDGEIPVLVAFIAAKVVAVGVAYLGAKFAASVVNKEASEGVDTAMSIVREINKNEIMAMAVGEGVGFVAGATMRFARVCAAKKKIRKASSAIEDYLGPDAKAKINEAGDLVVESSDGTKKVRFDMNDPSPHKNPHGHVEEFKKRKNKMKPRYRSGPIYPKGVPHE